MDLSSSIFVVIMLFFLATIFVRRIILLCCSYVKTGDIGDEDGFLLYNLFEKRSLKYIVISLFNNTHPIGIITDVLILFLTFMALGAILSNYVLFMISIAIGLFILLLRVMRKRYAVKQEFIEKLEGKQNDV